MTTTTKAFAGAAALVVLFAGWRMLHPPASPLRTDNGGPATRVLDFDQFQQDLASRVLKQLGGGKDLSVIVAATAYPIGTLLRASGSVPANLDDCAPQSAPRMFPAEHLFPSYTMSSDAAVSADLGFHALQGLGSGRVRLQQSQAVRYTIADTRIQILDDKSVEALTGQGNCGKYIAAHPGMRLVRGAVVGRITFTAKVDNPASARVELAKFGGVSVQEDPNSSNVSVADTQDEAVVELLSEFSTETRGVPSKPTAVPPPVSAPVSEVQEVHPHMFIQMDEKDTQEASQRVIRLLGARWPFAEVEPTAERIPTAKMPAVAQVRYFNEADAAMANRCGAILREIYPGARVVRVGLPSPRGQMEVWMARVQ